MKRLYSLTILAATTFALSISAAAVPAEQPEHQMTTTVKKHTPTGKHYIKVGSNSKMHPHKEAAFDLGQNEKVLRTKLTEFKKLGGRTKLNASEQKTLINHAETIKAHTAQINDKVDRLAQMHLSNKTAPAGLTVPTAEFGPDAPMESKKMAE